MAFPNYSPDTSDSESHWISISDLMSVLMMVFLFIAVSYMLNVTEEKNKIEQIAITYNKLQEELYQDLQQEFGEDLEKWNASIDKKTLSVKFDAPEVLFAFGSAHLRNRFRTILSNFFPRYVSILTSEKYLNEIEEIRIEGHTSSQWNSNTYPQEAYIGNMELSQDRTREVLAFVLLLDEVKEQRSWIKEKLTANGLSSSKLILKADSTEDSQRSRRVEFRLRTNAEQRIVNILTATE